MPGPLAYILLAISWIVWCILHSLLISIGLMERVRHYPGFSRYYRLFYNLFAVVSLLPVLGYSYALRGPPLVAWKGAWMAVPVVLGAAALLLFMAGGRRYDFFQFIGLRQMRSENGCSVLTEDCSLDTGGVLSVVRHPWYAGGMLAVWARPLDLAAIVTNLVLCAYFAAGAGSRRCSAASTKITGSGFPCSSRLSGQRGFYPEKNRAAR